MRLEIRKLTGPHATEFYLAATPDPRVAPAVEAQRMFAAIAKQMQRLEDAICLVRAFVPDGCFEAYQQAWQAAAGEKSRCICHWLSAGRRAAGGIQAHLIAGPAAWTALRDDAGQTAGWTCRNQLHRWAVIGRIGSHLAGADSGGVRQALESAEALLAQADMHLHDVARTWFFLHDILGWYDQFNVGRNQVFKARNMLAPPETPGAELKVPASTGIGVAPACGSPLGLELLAVTGTDDCIQRRAAAGRQRCAYEYGSAFARAATAITPAGSTFFVSGTAAIDKAGKTCCVDDARGQIRMTLDNVQAVLAEAGYAPGDVVQAMAYCKSPDVASCFEREFAAALPWPLVVIVADVCRPDLLFEVEVAACRS